MLAPYSRDDCEPVEDDVELVGLGRPITGEKVDEARLELLEVGETVEWITLASE